MSDAPLAGRRIGITADRRWQEQAGLFEKRGATVVHGPTLRTVDLSRDDRLRSATEDVIAHPPDWVVATTGMGVRLWLDAAGAWGLADGLHRSLAGARIVARGAKATSALRGAGLEVAWRAPGETMTEVVEHLLAHDLSAARLVVQLFDPDDHPTTGALAAAAGELVEVPVYRWLLPDDDGPARRLIAEAAARRLDAVTFTSQPAVYNLFRIARRAGLDDAVRRALNGDVVPACIGPVCAEAATECGIQRPVWPEPNRLPAMVRQVTEALAGQQAGHV